MLSTGAVGRFTSDALSDPVSADTPFDLASLTKVFATTELVRRLNLPLDRPVQDFLPSFVSDQVTIEHLMRHESGLPAYCDAKPPVLEHVLKIDLEAPPGVRTEYSCLGFVLLRHVIEQFAHARFEDVFVEQVSHGFGWSRTRFQNLAPDSNCPPTSRTSPPGVVHDPLARLQNGVSGNAGLFGTAAELGRACQLLIADENVLAFGARVPGHERGLGWDLKSPEASSCGATWSANSFGHTGFTGTSVWLDPVARQFAILLTNAILSHSPTNLMAIRADFCDIVRLCG